ncbi:MAG: hypothetical protein AAF653_09395, partial [Chloroflexota bacterium]
MNAVKHIDLERGRVGGYLVVWGDAATRDLQGDYFTPNTDFALDWYPRRPVLYHHGLDGSIKAALVGQIDVLRADDTGIWAEAQLDLRHRYVRAVHDLVESGVLAWSSGSLPHLVERATDGRIVRWPLIEGSLTPTPAEPRYTDVHTVKSAYKALGLDTAPIDPDAAETASVGTQFTAPENENVVPVRAWHSPPNDNPMPGAWYAIPLPQLTHTHNEGETPMDNPSLKRLPLNRADA